MADISIGCNSLLPANNCIKSTVSARIESVLVLKNQNEIPSFGGNFIHLLCIIGRSIFWKFQNFIIIQHFTLQICAQKPKESESDNVKIGFESDIPDVEVGTGRQTKINGSPVMMAMQAGKTKPKPKPRDPSDNEGDTTNWNINP